MKKFNKYLTMQDLFDNEKVYLQDIDGYYDTDFGFGCDEDEANFFRFDGKDNNGFFWLEGNKNIPENIGEFFWEATMGIREGLYQ